MSFGDRLKMGDGVQVQLGCEHGRPVGTCDQCKQAEGEAPPQTQGEHDGRNAEQPVRNGTGSA